MENIRLEGGNYYHIYNRGNNRMNLFEEPADYERFLWLYDRYISPVAETLAWVLMPNHLHLLVRIKENVVYKYSKDKPVKPVLDWDKFFEVNKWETTDLSASEGPDNIGIISSSEGPDNIGIISSSEGPDNIGIISSSEGPDNIGKGGLSVNADRSGDAVGLTGDAVGLTGDAVGLTGDAVGLNRKPEAYKHFSHLFNAYTRYFHIRTGKTGNLFERPFKRILIDNDEYLKNVILYIHNNSVHHGFCSHPLEYPWSSYLSCVSEKPTHLKREFVLKLFGNKADFKTSHNENLKTHDLSAFEEPDNVGKRIN